MEPQVFLDGRVTLYPGDCLEVLRQLPENSVDAVCCDPPYHLTSIVKRFGAEGAAEAKEGVTGAFKRASAGFMGKQWDGGDIAFRVETWQAVLRVLKPGGYLLAFASTRGFGRTSVAIEDAGFITHPLIAWVFGSGFPKATRIKADGYDGFRYGGQAIKPAIEPIYMGQKPFEKGLSGTENILRHGTGALNIDGCRVDSSETPYEVKGWEQDQLLCDTCAALAEEPQKPQTPATRASSAHAPAERISSAKEAPSPPGIGRRDTGCSAGMRAGDTSTSSSTSKSGKKPMDPYLTGSKCTTETKTRETTTSAICSSCRKPITGHTTSGNITPATKSLPHDGSRPAPTGRDGEQSCNKRYTRAGSTNFAATPGPRGGSPKGRWPANLIHDGSEEVLAAFPEAPGQQQDIDPDAPSNKTGLVYGKMNRHGEKSADRRYDGEGATNFAALPGMRRNDSGSAARFFYQAKADAEDRIGSKHPTVKPLDLIQYLCRLITPPGGTVLDCFAGTGTTGEAAWREGFRAILIEREAEYQADIARRMDLAVKPTKRAAVAKTKGKLMGAEGTPLFGGEAA